MSEPGMTCQHKGDLGRIAGILIPMIALVGLAVSACAPVLTPVPTEIPTETPTETPTEIPIDFIAVGPESVPSRGTPYPTSLMQEQLKTMLGEGGVIPPDFENNPDVQAVIARIKDFYRAAGVNIDDPTRPDYQIPTVVTLGVEDRDSFRWTVVLKSPQGYVSGWLQIADPAVATGWRYGETPVTDSRFDRGRDQFRFGIPKPLHRDNHFEIGWSGGFWILIEVDKNGNPVRWLDVVHQELTYPADVTPPPTQEEIILKAKERFVDFETLTSQEYLENLMRQNKELEFRQNLGRFCP